MQCPTCGYNLQPWETACPRCVTAGQAPAPGPAPVTYPAAGGYGGYAPPGVAQPQPAWFQTLHTYVSPAGVTLALTIVLIIGAVVDGLSALSDIAQANMLGVAVAGGQVTETAALANDARQGLIGLAVLGMFILTVIVWCVWTSRVHKGSAAFGSRGRRFSSGWAVGWYFVPFMNLVRPYEAMKEIWQASDPDVPNYHGSEWQGAIVPSIVGWWWATFLIVNGISWIAARALIGANKTPQELLGATWMSAFSSSLEIVKALVAIIMIRRLAARQEETYARLYEQTYRQPQTNAPPAAY